MLKAHFKEYFYIFIGSIIFAAGVNLFVVPIGIYNGGIVGTAQIIRTVLVAHLGHDFPFDIAGLINFLLNLPLIIAAYYLLNANFVRKTIFSILVQTVAFSLIPTKALVSDPLASLTIGAILSGIGNSLVLVQKATAGGNDISGMLLMKYYPRMTIGKFNLIYNVFIYLICACLFDLETAIYSVLEAALFSFVIDARHLQNIEVVALIFTRNPLVKKMIIEEQHRGVTYWEGMGAYTQKDIEVLVTVLSKYEVPALKRAVKKLDRKSVV